MILIMNYKVSKFCKGYTVWNDKLLLKINIKNLTVFYEITVYNRIYFVVVFALNRLSFT